MVSWLNAENSNPILKGIYYSILFLMVKISELLQILLKVFSFAKKTMQSSKKLYKFPGKNKDGVQHASTTTYVWLSYSVAAWTVNKEWFGGNSFPWGHNDESSHYLADLAAAAKATSSKCCFLRHTRAAVALQHRKRTVQIFFCV